MIVLQKPASIVFFVRELRRTAAWYGDLLGIAPYRDDADFIGFHLEMVDLGFHCLDEKAGLPSASQISYWQVGNLDETVKEFINKGATLYRKPITIPEGGRVAQMRDPFGNVIGLMQKDL
ncbi:MAG: VOC family protein [Candidatus Kapaibacterium sp.]